MDLAYTPAYEAYRAELRGFIAAHWRPVRGDKAARAAAEEAFRVAATEAGYLYRHVPRAYGGSEQPADVLKGQIIREELERARAPGEHPGIGCMMLVPTLLEKGTEAQKQRFIRDTIAGRLRWAQGYSEPGAGSDLASLRTRAVLEGDRWVINGQKIWSTLAHTAHWMFVLARTEPEAPKHAGISYLLVDLKQPGITIRPLKQITGWSEFCEVFFDDATTPAEMIVGARGQGWQVSRATLKHERSSIGGAARGAKLLERLVELAQTTARDGAPAIRQPQVRQRLAAIAGLVASSTYSSYRQTSMAARGQDPGLIELLFKLYATNIGHEVAHAAREIIGDDFMLAPPRADVWHEAGLERWNNQYMGSIAVGIAGGASNIQRNIIAERGLRLPRGAEEAR